MCSVECVVILGAVLCSVHSSARPISTEEGTIKGIVGIIHCRLIQLTADRISESELTDGIPKYISKFLKTDKIYS